MSIIKYTLIFVFLAVLYFAFTSPPPFYFLIASLVNQKYNDKEIKPEQLSLLLAKKEKILLIDVRTTFEYQLEHIPTAVSFPVENIETSIKQIKMLAKNRKVIIYCSMGARSYHALYLLENYDITGVNLKGGFEAWWDFQNKNKNTTDEN